MDGDDIGSGFRSARPNEKYTAVSMFRRSRPRFRRCPLAPAPTPVEELSNLRAALGGGPRLLIKRDDAIGFAFGGNKVRKMRLVAADAAAGAAPTR